MNGKAFTCLLGLLLLLTQPGVALDSFVNPANGVGPVPLGLGIDPFYEKYLDADGIAIVSSGKVADEALVMARRMVTTMLSKRSDVRTVMVEKGCKLMIIGQHEQVCDLPEYKHLCNTPEKAAYWNQRARGFGGDPEGSYSASCGEENVLCLEGDRYVGESILVHEFAHLIHDEGIAAIEPGFNAELEALYQQAIEQGLWENTYAISSAHEYFAEGVQSFFDCNRYSQQPNGVHNAVNTRAKLKEYDPGLYTLLARYFPETDLGLCDGNYSARNGASIKDLYQQADEYQKRFASLYYYNPTNVQPIPRSGSFVYFTRTPQGREFYVVDAERKTTTPAFDPTRLADSLAVRTGQKVEPYDLPFQQVRLNRERDSLFFSIEMADYVALLGDYTVKKIRERARRPDYYWGRVFKEDSRERVTSPDGKSEAYISEGNLWVRDKETGQARRLSDDGSPYEYYSSNIYWSPDSRKIVCSKYRPGSDRELLLIASSPSDQLQPKTERYDYVKPGDALPVRRPVLFLLDEGEAVQLDVPDVEMQYSLGNVRWNDKSDSFTFDFNKRGHQQFIIYAVDVATRSLRTLVNEVSPTFVHYSELYRYWFEGSDELLWISERDGWRHLYLYNSVTGEVKKQLTKGEWIVKRVVHVNEKERRLIFVGCGMDKGEDPYLEKYYTLDIDKGRITALTPENAQHSVTFSSDYTYMFDSYSRVDLPPVLVIRSVEAGGDVVYRPDTQPDISGAIAAGWRLPEVFTAKGRDGETDIWGMIIRPTHFDPTKRYPVIEYIYAGPHDSHVPKGFAIEHHGSALAELGFITVLIDGMGTSNRSKAFHDVCWKNLKDAGFPDRIAWIKAAAARYPEMDIERVGIYGASAGGQSSMGALLFHPDFYKVAVSSCGCHDNRMDKIWWNEQWMGYPIGKHYAESSNMENAHRLEGKLMLILGELDNNVDPSSTLQVVNKLIEHDKEFEFVMLPGAGHTLGGKYGERKRRDFFVKHLLGCEPPEWNREEATKR